MFGGVYSGTRTLVTGHTGFKGSWLTLWLQRLGAEVSGYALAPATQPNHHDLLSPAFPSSIADIRDYEKLLTHVRQHKPAIVFHLAAQASVLPSYQDPLETYTTNVLGTAHVREACRHAPEVRAVVVVTTDKCYEDQGWTWGYRESDILGGHDPYSASKACAEIVTASYRRSFFAPGGGTGALIATARSGNVIGGGDWTADRLVPDVMRAVAERRSVTIRNPGSSRPWQHVLEPLCGYLLLGQRLLEGRREVAEAWNFGPDPDPNLSVVEVVEVMARSWSLVRAETGPQERKPHETTLLMLDSTKARRLLQWRPVWSIGATLERTLEWYRGFIEHGTVGSTGQIDQYVRDATEQGATWAQS